MRCADILRGVCATAVLLFCAMQQASADIKTITGDTTNGPEFIRPAEWGGPPHDFTTGVRYQAFNVSVTESDWLYTFSTNCDFNCVSFFYDGGFDPLDPGAHLYGADGNDGYNLTYLLQAMEPGKTYTYVVAGFYDGDWGAFSTTVGGRTGTISISAVPEPSTALMLLGAMPVLALLLRRRQGTGRA